MSLHEKVAKCKPLQCKENRSSALVYQKHLDDIKMFKSFADLDDTNAVDFQRRVQCLNLSCTGATRTMKLTSNTSQASRVGDSKVCLTQKADSLPEGKEVRCVRRKWCEAVF